MSTILAFAGSNASASINYQLVSYASSQITEHSVNLLNLAHYPFPMYSIDLEQSEGFSNSLREFCASIQKAEGLVLSVSEHNSMPSAYFKNLLDWLSRVDRQFLANTKVFLMGASPGQRGAMTAMKAVADLLPRFGAEVIAEFSLPSFGQNFDQEQGILDAEKKNEFEAVLNRFKQSLSA
jgi:NAD(P)H-dependent FMN reductase